MQYSGPAPPLGAPRQFLIPGHHITRDRVLKTFVLAPGRRDLRREFRWSGERGRDCPVDGLIRRVGAQAIQRMGRRDDEGVSRILSMVHQPTTRWPPDNFVLVGQVRRILLEVPKGNSRLGPGVEAQ